MGTIGTRIDAGAASVDGNPYEPLSVSVGERFPAEVTALSRERVGTAADYRRLSVA